MKSPTYAFRSGPSLVVVCLLLGSFVSPIVVEGQEDSLTVTPRHAGHKPASSTPTPFTPPLLTPGYIESQDTTLNQVNTSTGIYSGGLPYGWTMGAAANYSATFDGIVGARSWHDPSLTESHHGRVRSSEWVAIELRVSAEITVSLSRKGSISDFLSPLPGGVAGGALIPAFTLYRGWQDDGAEGDLYDNQGAVNWAPSLEYVDHESNDAGSETVMKTYSLEKGKYTLALGGADDAGPVSGRQGFTATVGVVSLARPAAIGKAKKRYVSRGSSTKIKGLFVNHESAALLAVQQNRKTKTYPARGAAWSAKAKRLKRGTNYVFVAAVSLDGKISRWKKLKIIRK